MIRRSDLSLLFCLAACGASPDVPESAGRGQNGAWPELMPLSELVAPEAAGTTGEADALRLAGRAAALRQRAALLRRPVDGDGDLEALRALIGR